LSSIRSRFHVTSDELLYRGVLLNHFSVRQVLYLAEISTSAYSAFILLVQISHLPGITTAERNTLLSTATTLALHCTNQRRVHALTVIAHRLSDPDKESMINAALTYANNISNDYDRTIARAVVAPHLPTTERAMAVDEGVTAVISRQGDWESADFETDLPLLASQFSPSHLDNALSSILSNPNIDDSITLLCTLGPYFLRQHIETGISSLMPSIEGNVLPLAILTSHLPENLRAPLIPKIIAATTPLYKGYESLRALAYVFPDLDLTLQLDVINGIFTYDASTARGPWPWDRSLQWYRDTLIDTIAPHLASEHYFRALAISQQINDHQTLVDMLSA
jgi:hypothetical protein